MQRLSSALSGFLSNKLNASFPFRLVQLWERWDALLGEELASLAKPLGHRKETLVVGVEDPVAMQEASFYGPDILEAANGFLGQNYFDKVQFELLMKRIPLNVATQTAYGGLQSPLRPPGDLGRCLHVFDPNSIVARCYKAYVALFQEQDARPAAVERTAGASMTTMTTTQKKKKTTRKRRRT